MAYGLKSRDGLLGGSWGVSGTSQVTYLLSLT